MSLFGGEASATSGSLSRDPSPYTHNGDDLPQAAQIEPSSIPSQDPNTDDYGYEEEDLDLPDAPDDSGSDDDEPDRPNRFIGQPQTWRRYTASDRELATSMEKILAGDLSAHLYNAHAQKRAMRCAPNAELENWHSKARWYKEGGELWEEKRNEEEKFLLWKRWAAWPLPDAPRLSERFGVDIRDDEDAEWTIGGGHNPGAGDDLRDVVLGAFQRFAKEKWDARSSGDTDTEEEPEIDSGGEAMVKQESRSRSRSTARRSRMQSAETRSPASVRSRAQSDPETSPSRETSPRDIEQDAMSSTEIEVQSDGNTSETSDRPKRRRGYRGSRAFFKAQVPPSRPVVLADDEKARKILLPTINSLLSRMDGLLDTLRRSRQNQWIIPGENDSDGSAISRGTSPSRSRSRSRRPPTAEGYRQPASQRDENRPNNSDHDSAPRSSKRKRDPTLSNVADPKSASETDHPPEESVDAQNDQGPQKRKRKRRGANKVPTLRLRDWSEVLGLASMTGWDAAIIDRAAKRCSALFGESMAFRTLHEEGSEKPPDDPVQYTPDLIFAPKPLDNDIEAANSSSERPYWEQGAQRCPHVGCFGNQEDYFPIAYRAVEHCKKHHGYDPRDQENQSTPMLGAIHEDGFLQPIPLQRGWRGGDKDNSEKRLKHAVERTSRRTSRN